MRKRFPSRLLKVEDWQYSVIHKDVTCFRLGEKVFLKSNPEYPMMVSSLKEDTVVVARGLNQYEFPPECLLQYKCRPLLEYKGIFDICLN